LQIHRLCGELTAHAGHIATARRGAIRFRPVQNSYTSLGEATAIFKVVTFNGVIALARVADL